MTVLPSYGSTTSLFDDDPKFASRAVSRQQNSMFRDFLRHIRLLLPGSLLGHRSPWRSCERRKVAAYQSRRMATLTSLLHFIPLGGATTLLVLFWTKFWIGRDPSILTALQFIAKFHEILMQASLVDIFIYFIRSQAINGYIPLGALSGAAQASQLSYLWSLDFMSAIGSPTFGVWRRMAFALTASLMLFMITAVGPSAAVLMIPRPDMAHINATELFYLDIPEPTIYPSHLNMNTTDTISNVLDVDSSMFNEFGTIENPRGRIHKYMQGSKFNYLLVDQPRGDSGEWNSSQEVAIATVPTDLSIDLVTAPVTLPTPYKFLTLENVTAFILQSPQPFVHAQCSRWIVTGNEDFYSDDGSKKLLNNARGLYEKWTLANQTFRTTEQKSFPTLWTSAPGDPHTLVAMKPLENSPDDESTDCLVCSVVAFWRTTKTSRGVNNGAIMYELEVPDLRDMTKEDFKPLFLDLALLEFDLSENFSIPVRWAENLAINVANALAIVPSEMFDKAAKSRMWGLYQEAGRSDVSPVRIDIVNYGFGYGIRDTPTQLSVAVITTYCFITLLYIGFITITGHASIAWTSPTELIMLALQSKEPSNVGYISVGIDSMETLRRNVGIRVSTVNIGDTGGIRERLELVFEDDEETERRDLTKVVRGRAY